MGAVCVHKLKKKKKKKNRYAILNVCGVYENSISLKEKFSNNLQNTIIQTHIIDENLFLGFC